MLLPLRVEYVPLCDTWHPKAARRLLMQKGLLSAMWTST
jgi:hypothetical protein